MSTVGFRLRSKNYWKNKIKITKSKPLLQLEKIYIIENNQTFEYDIDNNSLILYLCLHNKSVIFIYNGVYDVDNYIIKRFLNGTINRKTRLKVVPSIDCKLSFIKLKKPILLAKKIKTEFNRHNNCFEIKINLKHFFIQKIIDKLIKNKSRIFLGLTIETYKEDYLDEELLCIFGLNDTSDLLKSDSIHIASN